MVEGYKGRELAAALAIADGELEDLEEGLMVKLEAANRYTGSSKGSDPGHSATLTNINSGMKARERRDLIAKM